MSDTNTRNLTPWQYSPSLGGHYRYNPVSDEIVLSDQRCFPRPKQVPAASLVPRFSEVQASSPSFRDGTLSRPYRLSGRCFGALDSRQFSPFSDEDDYHGDFDDEHGQEGDSSHVASGRATDHRSNKTVGDISHSPEDTAVANEDDAYDNISDDEAELGSDDVASDGYHVALKKMTGHGRTTDPLTQKLHEISRLANGTAIVAAFRDYSVHSDPGSDPLIGFIDIRTPADYETVLLDPSKSDARVRAYFRGILEKSEMEAHPTKSTDGYAPKAAQLLEGLVQREMGQSIATGWSADSRPVVLPILRYALAKAYLASDRVRHGLVQLQKVLGFTRQASIRAKGDHDVLHFACQRLIVHAWQRTRKLHKAIPLLEEMISEQVSKHGEVHPSVFELLNALAAAYEANQQAPKAISLLEDMLKLHDHQHHQSQLTALHLLLRAETMAGKVNEAEMTIAHISDVVKRSVLPLSPLQTISRSAISPVAAAQNDRVHNSHQAPHIASNNRIFSNNTLSLQRLVDHMIDSQPDDDFLPPDLSERIATYKKHAETTRHLQLSDSPTSSSAVPSVEGLDTAHSSGMLSTQSTPATSVVAATSKMIDITAVASNPGPMAIGAAAVGVSGAIGLAAASLYRLFFVELPQLKLSQDAGRVEKAKSYADLQTALDKRLGFIKGLALAEEEAAREKGDFDRMKKSKDKFEHDLQELQDQNNLVEERRKADLQQERALLQQEKAKSAEVWLGQAAKIERLEKELKNCRERLSSIGEVQEPPSSVLHERSRHAQSTNQPDDQTSEHEMEVLQSAQIESDRQLNILVSTERLQTCRASNGRLRSDLDTALPTVKKQLAKIVALEAKLIETQRERNEYQTSKSVQNTRSCGDSRTAETCQSCVESHKSIHDLRTTLEGEDFGGHEAGFLNSLDPSRDVSELVQILSGRLKSFIQALYWDLIPLDTRQKADIHNARADVKDLQAKLKDAEISISDLRSRLAKSSGKASRLEQSLIEARSEQTKIPLGTAERVNSASHEAADQQAGPWWRSIWPPPR
jgi:hypothetical protein